MAGDGGGEERKTFTWSKTGTLPTLERLLEEMATLEEQQLELKNKKEEVGKLIEINKKLTARNYFLERENNTLRLDKNATTTRSFEYPSVIPGMKSDDSSGVELMILNKRHPAHEDDRVVVKMVTAFIFMFLPALLGVGVWAACLLDDAKIWYDVTLESPLKINEFYIFGGVWCAVYASMGLALYLSWYHMGGRRGIPYIILGLAILLTALSYPPVLLIGQTLLLPAFVLIGVLWALCVLGIMVYARISMMTGISLLPTLLWTSYTLMFTFFPFYEKYWDSEET